MGAIDFASKPQMRLPSTAAVQPLNVFRSTPSYPAFRPPGGLPHPSFVRTTTIPSIAHVKENLRGLQTPPPEMTAADPRPTPYPCSVSHGFLRPFDYPIAPSLDAHKELAYQRPTYSPKHVSVYDAQEAPDPQPKRRRSSSSRTGASMVVPCTINSTKANLADFAAQITCLFWFESALLLQNVAESPVPPSPSPLSPLAADAIPTSGFRKWVTTILSTTQVSQNVVLLALLFIHRLKKLNPTVQGKPGSEFRLFTIALMLGNKYLDDNTYTNKTWAEVSGIAVQEIHIMEVEFLSNMRYSLYVGDREWKQWHTKLGRLWDYWDKASRLPLDQQQRVPAAVHSPSRLSLPSSLPSPPPSTNSSPPFMHSHTPPTSATYYLPAPHPLDPPHLPVVPMPQPDFDLFSRKRSFDYTNAMQPPTKRFSRSNVPKLSLNVPQAQVFASPIPLASAPPRPRLHPLDYPALPPCQPFSRPADVPGYVQQLQQCQAPQLPLPVARSVTYSQPPSTATAPMGLFNPSPYSTRQTSPHSAYHSVSSSPITPSHASQQSPSWSLLKNRDSPYRPVCGVNTLLVPPHTSAPQPTNIALDQMRYQPLAKSKVEYKTGVVPYLQPEGSWPQSSWADPAYYAS